MTESHINLIEVLAQPACLVEAMVGQGRIANAGVQACYIIDGLSMPDQKELHGARMVVKADRSGAWRKMCM